MRVSLKNGALTVALTKREESQVREAIGVCGMVAQLSPLPAELVASAKSAMESLSAMLDKCGTKPESIVE